MSWWCEVQHQNRVPLSIFATNLAGIARLYTFLIWRLLIYISTCFMNQNIWHIWRVYVGLVVQLYLLLKPIYTRHLNRFRIWIKLNQIHVNALIQFETGLRNPPQDVGWTRVECRPGRFEWCACKWLVRSILLKCRFYHPKVWCKWSTRTVWKETQLQNTHYQSVSNWYISMSTTGVMEVKLLAVHSLLLVAGHLTGEQTQNSLYSTLLVPTM